MTKDEKNILKQYADFTDKELLNLFHDIVKDVTIIVSSEREAEILLQKYRRTHPSFFFNKRIKHTYFILKECIRLRGLKVPNEWYNVNMTEKDVIKRLNEARMEEIYQIESCKDLFETYLFDEDSYELSDILSPEYLINRINISYETIIKNEFSSKQLKKQS